MSGTSNYETMKNQMRFEFLKYDQEKMIKKFSLSYDEQSIYIRFVERNYSINRQTGRIVWSDDGFKTETEANYNEAMTIYDVLCYSKEDCRLAGTFCQTNNLKGTVHMTGSLGSFSGFFQQTANLFSGKTHLLEKAVEEIGQRENLKGDVAARIQVFDFMPLIIQYWDGDEEFSPVWKFMVDENIQDFMHFETVMFMLNHVADRIVECAKKINKK
jgi:hypothetical protein